MEHAPTGSSRVAQADKGLLDARALGQDLARVLGIGVIQGARVHLQRGLGLAEAAQAARSRSTPSSISANARV